MQTHLPVQKPEGIKFRLCVFKPTTNACRSQPKKESFLEMTRKISVRLPERMIQQIDAVGGAESPFKFSFFGLRETRSLKLQSLIEQAFETQLNIDPEKPHPAPEVPTLTPISQMADAVKVDTETLGSGVMSRKQIENLDNAEMLACILDEDELSTATDLKTLAGQTASHLKRKFDLGIEKANRLSLIFEFGKRLATSHSETQRITTPADIADYLMPRMRYLQHEVVVCLALNTKGYVTDNLMIAEDTNTAESAMGELIGHRRIFEGTLNASVFHPREIFRYAIDCNANTIILVHNHPSGDPQPSQEDIRATKQLIEAGNQIGIKVLDHIVIGDGVYISLKEEDFI